VGGVWSHRTCVPVSQLVPSLKPCASGPYFSIPTPFLPKPRTTNHLSNHPSPHRGVWVFRCRQTPEHAQRRFRHSSLGIDDPPRVRCTACPHPWQHVFALQFLADDIYGSLGDHSRLFVWEPQGDNWTPTGRFFDRARCAARTWVVQVVVPMDRSREAR
jgi:hypothetical protein